MGLGLRSALVTICLVAALICQVCWAQDASDGIADDAADTVVVGETDFDISEDSFEDVPANRAVLIAHKHVQEEYIVHGRNMTVNIKLYNVGTGSADDVKVKDAYPVNATFQLVEGSLERSLGSIEAGRTAEFRYVMIPKGGQRSIECPAAEVTYASAAGLPTSELRSTIQQIEILSKAQHFEQILVNVGKVATLGMLRTSTDWFNSMLAISVTVAALGAFLVLSALTSSRASSKRDRAAKEFGLEDE